MSIDKISASNSKFENLRWTSYYKAKKLGESMFVRQSEMLIPEEELGSQSNEEDFEDF